MGFCHPGRSYLVYTCIAVQSSLGQVNFHGVVILLIVLRGALRRACEIGAHGFVMVLRFVMKAGSSAKTMTSLLTLLTVLWLVIFSNT